MSGSTTELNLSTAVDADDNADYLTINLANSLRTLDGLFNNVTGHTHGGAHQGAPVNAADIGVNLLVNGGFEIWSRGNGPYTSGGAQTADRWGLALGGTSTVSVVRDTTNKDASSASCAAITYTHNATSALSQTLTDQFGQLAGRTITCTVRVRTSTANAVALTIGDNIGSAQGSFHSGSGTYEKISVTRAIPAGVTSLGVNIGLFASCTAYVDNAMLVIGSVLADYVPLHPADEQARCLRYYEIIGNPPVAGAELGVGQCYSTTNAAVIFRYVTKPVAPTVTTVGTLSLIGATGTPIAMTSSAVLSSGPTSAGLACQVASGLVAGNATRLYASATNQYVVVEANP